MATLQFANAAKTTLAGPISSTATTLNVAAGSGTLFPTLSSGQYFKLVLRDAATKLLYEVVHVTATSGDTFTVVRGQESTAQLSWNAGDFAANLVTAGTFGTFVQVGSIPASFVTGTDTGPSANTVICATTVPAVGTPSPGQTFEITKSANGNTGATTFQIASGTAYSVVYKDGSALEPGAWPAGAAAFLYFTGGVMQFVACQGAPAVRTYYGADTGTADALVATPVPAVGTLTDNLVVIVKKGTVSNATASPTLAVSGLAATVIVRADGSAVVAGDLLANYDLPLKYDATTSKFRLLWPIAPTQVRIKLSGNLTIYVRTDGSDANNGLANTPSGAFATIQGAWNAIFGLYDPAGYTITIRLGITGTYAGATFSGYTGTVVLTGDPAVSGAGYTVNCGTNDSCIVVNSGGPQLTIQNLTMDFSYNAGSSPLEATVNTAVATAVGPNVTYNCNNNRPNLAENFLNGSGASLLFVNNSTVTITGTGSRGNFVFTGQSASMGATNVIGATVTFTFSNSVTYSTFAIGTAGASQNWSQAVFTNASLVTATKYSFTLTASLILKGVVLPGNTAGNTSLGGQVQV